MSRPLLFVGDIHLGRRPTGLDAPLAAAGLSPRELSPAAAWTLAVQHAVRVRARAVVLAGDVVDAEKDRFEAYGHLEAGARQLRDADIPVFAVAGNHDGLVLPRLARAVEGITLLGEGGTWACHPLDDDEAPVDLVGWSFPERVVRQDPLTLPSFATAIARRRPGARLLGVVHGDLDVATSPYAPLDRRRLTDSPVNGWFLGHIHRPHDLGVERPVGYLGSLVGLDAGEPGARGPWEVDVTTGVRARQVPLAPVRWEGLDVPVDDVQDVDGVIEAIRARIGRVLDGDATFDAPQLRAVVWRVRLTGRPAVRQAASKACAAHDPADVFEVSGRLCILERLTDATRIAVDVDALAGQATPAGRIARRLLELRAGRADDLVERGRHTIDRFSSGRWSLGGEPDSGSDVREALEEACWRALEVLADQRSEGVR